MKFPKVAVVIPAYNEEKDIKDLLDSLMRVNYPKKKFNIIVVDDGSTDNTSKIISKYPIKVIKGKHEGASVARNLGWKSTKSDIVIFLDADMVVHKNFIKELIKPLENKDVGGVYFLESFFRKKSLIAKLSFMRKVLINLQKSIIAKAIRKKTLIELNGLIPRYGYYDDWELAMRIKNTGYKIVNAPKALIWHKEPETFYELYKQYRWAGQSMLSLTKYKGRMIRSFGFILLGFSLPFYLLFIFLPYPFWVIGEFGLSLFLIIEVFRSFKMFLITKQKESFLTPFFDFLTSLFICVGIIKGLTKIKSRPKI